MLKLRKMRFWLLLLSILTVFVFGFACQADAAESDTVKSITNVSSGIRITWRKNTKQTGYKIYRKTESSTSWKLVRTVRKNTTVSWVDKAVYNGKKYTYKVSGYKGKKIKKAVGTRSIYYVGIPNNVKTQSNFSGTLYLESKFSSFIDGYQAIYSVSKNFSAPEKVTVTGNALKKSIVGLTGGKTYYVKVRAYKVINNKKYYSGYTAVKTVSVKKASQDTYHIKGVSNISDGICVKWGKDTGKTGYKIYRKKDDEAWRLITQIDDNTVTDWTDKDTYQGKKYVYKVCGYKGNETGKSDKTKTVYRLKTPALDSVKSDYAGALFIKSNYSSEVSGYEIIYSLYTDLSGSKVKSISGCAVKQNIEGLSFGKEYFLKIRAYKEVKGKKYYSGYTALKSATVKSAYDAYLAANTLLLYDTYSQAYNLKAPQNPTRIAYMTKVKLYGVCFTSPESNNKILKFSYNGKIYYAWQKANTEKFTAKKSSFKYSTTTAYEKAAVDIALDILNNYPNKYIEDWDAYSRKPGELDPTDGKYGFDCSNFATLVLEKVMKPEIPVYDLSADLDVLYGYQGFAIYNKGYSNAFYPKTVAVAEQGKAPDTSNMRAGDIIFFGKNENSDGNIYANHCAIYLGKNEFIHATGGYWNRVCIMALQEDFAENFLCAVRYLPETAPVPANDVLYVDAERTCRVYSEPDFKSEIKENIYAGTKVTLKYSGTFEVWGYVSYGSGKTGYIKLADLTAQKPTTVEEIRYVNKAKLKLYADADVNSASIELPGATKLIYNGRLGTGNYYKVIYDGKQYFVYSTEGTIDEKLSKNLFDLSETRYAASNLRLYSKPVVADYITVKKGSELTYHGRLGSENYYIVTYNEKTYFIYDSTETIDGKLSKTA